MKYFEPFSGLFTQGMITHQTYRDQNNNWLRPNEIFFDNKSQEYKNISNEEKIKIGRVEKMSKSKQNVIDPSNIIDTFGADTARWYMMSDSPPERDLEWTESGIEGSYKFINKIWRLVNSIYYEKENSFKNDTIGEKVFNKKTNEYVVTITNNIQKFHFNKVVANIHEVTSIIQKEYEKKNVSKKTLVNFVNTYAKLIHPIIPHISEEVWKLYKNKGMVVNQMWPTAKEEFGSDKESVANIAIQINGKTRSVIQLSSRIEKKEVEKIALLNEKILKYTKDKKIKKMIFVPNKVLNIVL